MMVETVACDLKPVSVMCLLCLWSVCYLSCTSLPVREVCLHLTCIVSVFLVSASMSVLMSCASS